MSTHEEQVRRATIAHASIQHHLNNSTVVLRKGTRFTHKAKPHPLVGDVEFWPLESRVLWCQGAHHDLLMDMLNQGLLPHGWPEGEDVDSAADIGRVAQYGQRVGYRFSPSRLERRPPSHAESEAWHAAQSLARGDLACFQGDAWDDARKWRKWLRQVTGSFIIPCTARGASNPYIADQLWIVEGQGIRLLVLEIDGEQHLDESRKEADRRRDTYIESLGYEVYRVAGWWARIDPFRVICEFLHASGLYFGASRDLIFGHASRPSDYQCAACGEPMIRYDINWIQSDYDGNPIHEACN